MIMALGLCLFLASIGAIWMLATLLSFIADWFGRLEPFPLEDPDWKQDDE